MEVAGRIRMGDEENPGDLVMAGTLEWWCDGRETGAMNALRECPLHKTSRRLPDCLL